jgi:hypothetical protein
VSKRLNVAVTACTTLACFWPSDETGMPHALMGKYRLVNLR